MACPHMTDAQRISACRMRIFVEREIAPVAGLLRYGGVERAVWRSASGISRSPARRCLSTLFHYLEITLFPATVEGDCFRAVNAKVSKPALARHSLDPLAIGDMSLALPAWSIYCASGQSAGMCSGAIGIRRLLVTVLVDLLNVVEHPTALDDALFRPIDAEQGEEGLASLGADPVMLLPLRRLWPQV
ncbi:hypothetical protein D3C76_1212150 [compost metagenome]